MNKTDKLKQKLDPIKNSIPINGLYLQKVRTNDMEIEVFRYLHYSKFRSSKYIITGFHKPISRSTLVENLILADK